MNPTRPSRRRPELMAPAGGPDAAFAAFHYGADAVYLGLRQFSARADAENFTPEQLDELVAFAHALEPRRRVYVALNTLILDREIADLTRHLARVADLGVDALIVQDAGLVRIAQRHFPELRLHASTQMAVHNRAGVERLRDLGFARATLARELTLDEIAVIAGVEGIEIECFVHGALCYCYSGLCLYSSLATGRSGNRGRCAYLCRDRFAEAGGGGERGAFRFSMKDLALPAETEALAAAGVDSLKIEGRKKSPLYVAAVTNFYRRLIDGTARPAERRAMEQDLQSIFSRPWTTLFAAGRDPDAVVDSAFVGHRGTPLGAVEAVLRRGGSSRLRFTPSLAVERHDGLQIDVAGLDRPFGFPVDRLFIGAGGHRPPREVFEARPGDPIEIELPPDAPEIPIGATVYGASSQAVRRRYRFDRPRPGLHRVRRAMDVTVSLAVHGLSATGRLAPRHARESPVEASVSIGGGLSPARNAAGTHDAVQRAFGKLGDTRLSVGALIVENPAGLFAPASVLNDLRRQLAAAVEAEWEKALATRVARALADDSSALPPATQGTGRQETWRIKIDRVDLLDTFTSTDLTRLDEVIFDIGFCAPGAAVADAARLAERVGRERVRLALPVITRAWNETELRESIDALLRDGWNRWEISNLSGWRLLPAERLDLCGGWPLYALNRQAIRFWIGGGLTSVTLSPEDGRGNLRELIPGAAAHADVPLYEDVPLFISEIGACALDADGIPPSRCTRACAIPLTSSRGDAALQVCHRGRTVVLGRAPLCWAGRLEELRAMGARRFRVAFQWRPYGPEQVRDLWRRLRAGRAPDESTPGNFEGGLA